MSARPNNKVSMTKDEHATLVLFAADGRQYREDLKTEILGLARLLGDEALTAMALKQMESVDALKVVRTEFRRRWDAKLPPRTMAALPSGEAVEATSAERETWKRLGVDPALAARFREE